MRITRLPILLAMMLFTLFASAETEIRHFKLFSIDERTTVEGFVVPKPELIATTNTHTRCQIYEYYEECEVWECDNNSESGTLSQNLSCVLKDKYACDVGIDCDDDQVGRSVYELTNEASTDKGRAALLGRLTNTTQRAEVCELADDIDSFAVIEEDGADGDSTSACLSIADCNDFIALCIKSGGDFTPDSYDTDSGAPATGMCTWVNEC